MSVFIIAEAGVNHNGSLESAKKLIDIASNAKANAVKFQTFRAEKIVTLSASKARYQKKGTQDMESQYELLKRLELSNDDFLELYSYCKEKNIIFMSTPFDIESAEFLNSLGMQIFKIPSGEITNLPYIRYIGGLKKQVILSSGMSTIEEIHKAYSVLIDCGTMHNDITVLHANTMYPTPMEDVNLRAMKSIRKALKVKVGYSDHTMGIEVDIAAVAMGASVIEKHFTISKNLSGPDHKSSLEPEDLNLMVKSIRNIEQALGSSVKTPSPSELKNINLVRKSIVANQSIKVGDTFTDENITVKRPGYGISPMLWDKIIGTKSKYNFKPDDLIK